MGLRLHDAQSCVAREYGFASWADLQGFVAVRRAQADDPQQAIRHWLQCVYAGDIAGDMNRSRPALARRLLEDQPTLARQVAADPWLACAVGDVEDMALSILRLMKDRALAADLGRRGLERAEDYDWGNVVAVLRKVYFEAYRNPSEPVAG